MQRPFAVLSPYGSVSDTIDMKPVRTPTTRSGNGWLLKRGFEDTSVFITPELIRDRSGTFELSKSAGGYKIVQTEHGPTFEVSEPTKNVVLNPRMEGLYTVNYPWDERLNGNKAALNWDSGYKSNVHNREEGYHAHVVEGAGPNGENAFILPDINTPYGRPRAWVATSALLGDISEFVEGAQVTISFDMKTSDIEKYLDIGIYGKNLSGSSTFFNTRREYRCTKVGVWERVEHTVTIPADFDNTQRTRLYIYGMYSPVEGITWVANPQVEVKPFSTPFCCGSLGDTDKWTGTPYESSSVRGSVNVNWDTTGRLHAQAGTLLVNLKPRLSQDSRYGFLRSGGTGSPASIRALISNTGTVSVNIGSKTLYGTTQEPHGWNTLILTWNGSTEKLFINGVFADEAEQINATDISGGIYAKVTVSRSNAQYRTWIAFDRELSEYEAIKLSRKQVNWNYNETSRFDLQYLNQPATILVFYRTSPEMPVQYTRLSGSGDIGGVGHLEAHETGLIVRTYDRMILDSVVLFNENLNTQDEEEFSKIPPAYQNHLVETTKSGRIIQGYGDKQLLVSELPKSLTGNRYYQLLVSSV